MTLSITVKWTVDLLAEFTRIFFMFLWMETPCTKFVVKVLLFKKRMRQCCKLRFQAQVKVRTRLCPLAEKRKNGVLKNWAWECVQTTIQ